MSAKKVTEIKKYEVDENTDSGFLSGQITSEQLSSDDVLSSESDNSNISKSEAKVTSASELEDQGLCLLTGDLDISDDTPPALEPQPALQPAKGAPAVTTEEARRLRNLLFSQDAEGDTPLHIAAAHGCPKSVNMLLKLCPDKRLLNITNDYGHTPLHLAIMSGHDLVARMLVREGADISVRDHTGETPLHTAVSVGIKECILAVLEPIGQKRIRSATFDQKNYGGQSCVHLAAYAGRVDLLRLLVLYGANVNVQEGCAGWTPLHIAARRNDAELARYLLREAKAARGARDFAGRTPRRLARAATFYDDLRTGSDSESDDEEDYESESEEFFSQLAGSFGAQSIDVV